MNRLFTVVKGAQFEAWRERILLPGGKIESWEERGDLAYALGAGNAMNTATQSTRWGKAQRAETLFWQSWRSHELYRDVSLPAFWDDILEKTGGPLVAGAILDVGCGPVSVLNFHRPAGVHAMGLDPLGAVYARAGLLENGPHLQPISIIVLPAETIPLEDASLDQVICFNVLDHVANAPAVLAEIGRVLRSGGRLRVYVHTFAKWIKRFLFFDRPHTYHWDHQEFRSLVCRAGFTVTHEYREPKTFDFPKGLWSNVRYFPYRVASKVAETSYFQFEKRLN